MAVRASAVWTEETIVEAIHRWYARYGRLPNATLWRARGIDPPHPPSSTVQNKFGSWNAAIEAAGFTPRSPGRHERTDATVIKMRAAQRIRHGWARKWGVDTGRKNARILGPFDTRREATTRGKYHALRRPDVELIRFDKNGYEIRYPMTPTKK